MRNRPVTFVRIASCLVSICGALASGCSGGAQEPAAAPATFSLPASPATEAQYGIVRWAPSFQDGGIVWTGYDGGDHAVRGIALRTRPVSGMRFEVTIDILDGVHGSLSVVANTVDGTSVVTGRPTLTASEARFMARAMNDMLAYEKTQASSGASSASLVPRPAAAGGGLQTLELGGPGCTDTDVVLTTLDQVACIGGAAVTIATLPTDWTGVTIALTAAGAVFTVYGCARGAMEAAATIQACTAGTDAGAPDAGSVADDGGFSADGGAWGDEGAGNSGGGFGEGGYDGGFYFFVEPKTAERHHVIDLGPAVRRTVAFSWHDAPGVAAPADLSVDVDGRPLVQVAAIGDTPFLRAGLEVVPLAADAPYRLILEGERGAVLVRVVDGWGRSVLRVRTSSPRPAADVVLEGAARRATIEADL